MLDCLNAETQVLPAKAEAAGKLAGVAMGPRLLMALVTAVEAVAGEAAAAQLRVVLHVNDAQEPAVVRDLVERKHLGLQPENVIVVTQARRPGYAYDHETSHFCRRLGSAPRQAGSGFAMMQLAWEGEGFWVDAQGARHDLPTSVFDHLLKGGVKWLLTRQLRDLSLYDPVSTLDVASLAYSLYLSESQGANMAVSVEQVGSLTGMAAPVQGLVLGHRSHEAGGRLQGEREREREVGRGPGTRLPAHEESGARLPAVEVKVLDAQVGVCVLLPFWYTTSVCARSMHTCVQYVQHVTHRVPICTARMQVLARVARSQ